jgi:hypothetical protein
LQASNDGDDEMKATIDMAREAGFETMLRKGKILGFDRDGDYTEELKDFEALVRADEREACAKVCESEAEMFKSCAYGANDGRYDWKEDGARECAVAIRNRGLK